MGSLVEDKVKKGANMKLVFLGLLLAFAGAYAKKELSATDCGGSDAILTLGSLTDLKGGGAVDKNSILKIVFSASKDTHHNDPFEVDFKFGLKKKVGFWYIPVPQFIIDKIGHSIHDPNVKYLGRSVFRVNCPFLNLYGSCLPRKGPHVEQVVMKSALEGLKSGGSVVRWFGSGWYRVEGHITT